MFGKRRSFAEAYQRRRKIARRFGALFLVFVCYELITGLFLSTYSIQSQAMAPTIAPGDRILATPLVFGPRTLFGKLPAMTRPERGDIIVADPSYTARIGFWGKLSDSFVRFFTFQTVSPAWRGNATSRTAGSGHIDRIFSAPTLQRVIALPGDSIRMEDFVFKVRTADSDQFLTEFELSDNRYDISHVDPPESWREDLPGSGRMEVRVLGKDEYFLAGDARSSSSDSRLWGPVRIDRFRAKALLRYWPLKSFGAP